MCFQTNLRKVSICLFEIIMHVVIFIINSNVKFFFSFYIYLYRILSPCALDLAEKMLSLDPAKRPSAREALSHDYFHKEEPLPCLPEE